MGDIARHSVRNESALYDALGINAELLIDHAWGWEPTDIATIKEYRPESQSISSGQVLKEPYDADKARLIVKEMTELLALDLVRKKVVIKQVTLTLGYDRTSIKLSYQGKTNKDNEYTVVKTGRRYIGKVGTDPYGRPCPKHAHGTGNLDHWTSSTAAIMKTMLEVFDRIVDKDLTIRRVNVVACNLLPEDQIPQDAPEQMNLFVDYEALEREKEERKAAEERERRIQRATIDLQDRYGKNIILKGINFLDGATTRERNAQIGGHRAGEDASSASSASTSTTADSRTADSRTADSRTADDTASVDDELLESQGDCYG
jgi:DNA polymerase V